MTSRYWSLRYAPRRLFTSDFDVSIRIVRSGHGMALVFPLLWRGRERNGCRGKYRSDQVRVVHCGLLEL